MIVAGGAFGTPELLLRSGIRSQSGELGRNLRIHPACWVGARFDDDVNGWDGVMQSYAVDEWQHEGVLLEATFTPLAFGGHWLPGIGDEHQERLASYGKVASTGVHLSDRSRGRVRLGPGGELRVGYRLLREDREKLVFGIARAAELFFAAGAREVYPQIAGVKAISPAGVAALDSSTPSARRMRLEAFHPLGTARMDADPSRGVTGIDGAVHGYRGLHVADASLFPTSIGVNPMMTIVAMAGPASRRRSRRRQLGQPQREAAARGRPLLHSLLPSEARVFRLGGRGRRRVAAEPLRPARRTTCPPPASRSSRRTRRRRPRSGRGRRRSNGRRRSGHRGRRRAG